MSTLARRILLLVIVLLSTNSFLGGCTPIVLTTGNPQPNIALVEHKKTLQLVIGPGVRDVVLLTRGISDIDVKGWRNWLATGFQNGFQESHTLVPNDLTSERTLTIDKADIEVGKRTVSGGTGLDSMGSITEYYFQIRYKATLRVARDVQRTAGTATETKKESSLSRSGKERLTSGIDSAIEAMYEALGKELFKEDSASPAK